MKTLATSLNFSLTVFNFNCRNVAYPTTGNPQDTTWHGEHMPKLSRKGEGKPLRDAMQRAGLTGPELAAATKEVDPTGKGVAPSTVGRIAGRGKTAGSTCQLKTAWFVAEALHRRTNAPLQDLFSMPPHSTSTVERSKPDAANEA